MTARRHTDRELYDAAARSGDQAAASLVLGVDPSWLGRRVRAFAKINGLRVPGNRGGRALPVRRAPVPDLWDHRRLADGGTRVRDQRRA